MTPRPLRGLRVLDLSQYIAGPGCGQLLADFGAEVIKIEPPGGDPARHLGRTAYGSTYFRQYNTGKNSRCLDLTEATDRTMLDSLLAGADALVVNFSHRTLRKLGLEWDAVHQQFPDLVMVTITAYGYGDPRTAFDSIAQAVSGYGYLNAGADGVPQIAAGYPTDVLTGLYAGMAAAMALLDRSASGGCLVDVPMVEVAMATLCGPSMLSVADGEAVPPGRGNRDVATAPSTTYGCIDGHVYIYAGLDKHWDLLLDVVDGERATLSERLANPDRFEGDVAQWTQARTVSEVCERMGELGIAAGVVEDPATALTTLRQQRPDAVVITSEAGAIPTFPVTFNHLRVQRRPAAESPESRRPT